MAEQRLTFQYDAPGLAAAVAKSLAAEPAGPSWGEPAAKSSLGRRALRFFLGPKRWGRLRMAACLRRLTARSAKPVLVYVVPFDIWKLRTGGGQRIAGIAKALSRNYNVLVLTSAWSTRTFAHHELGADCHLLAVPAGAGFMERLRAGNGAGFFAFIDHVDLVSEFRWMLKAVAGMAQAWGFVHPVAWPAVRPYLRPETPVFYDAHDDYAQFMQQAYGRADDRLVARLVELERQVLEKVAVAAFCTAGDWTAVRERNPACAAQLLVVPNGVDLESCRVVWPGQARRKRRDVGLGRPLAVFMGSIHKPNRAAVEVIVRDLAPAFPQVLFAVMGLDQAAYQAAGHAPVDGANLTWTGPVSEDCKEAVFALADVALAPMTIGTGSSLKIPDYVAHGKIVVATPIGLRGFEDLARIPSVVAAHDVRAALAEVLDRLAGDATAYDAPCMEAREWVEQNLDWNVAARPLVEAMRAGGGGGGRRL